MRRGDSLFKHYHHVGPGRAQSGPYQRLSPHPPRNNRKQLARHRPPKTTPQKAGNLASNANSLVESHYSEDAWVRAIYADSTTVVGFLMMAIWDPTEAYYIWRFMIDAKYQGLGFGKKGVELAIEHVRGHNPQAKLLRVMSTPPEGKESEDSAKAVKAEDSPYGFYVKLGFREINGPDEDGEHELALELQG